MLLTKNFIKTIIEKINKTEINIQDVLPTSWNHYKKEWIAVMEEKPLFISTKTNFSRSGANADLEINHTFTPNEIFIVKSGSHKHQTTQYYKVVSKTTCNPLFEIEDDEVKDYISGNFPELTDDVKNIIEKEIEKKKKIYKLNQKRARVMELAHKIARETKEETGEKASFSICLKLAWKYEGKFNFRSDERNFLSFLKKEEERQKEKKEKEELLKTITGSDGYWNGKIYGNAKYGYRIYIDGNETYLTIEQKEQLQAVL